MINIAITYKLFHRNYACKIIEYADTVHILNCSLQEQCKSLPLSFFMSLFIVKIVLELKECDQIKKTDYLHIN